MRLPTARSALLKFTVSFQANDPQGIWVRGRSLTGFVTLNVILTLTPTPITTPFNAQAMTSPQFGPDCSASTFHTRHVLTPLNVKMTLSVTKPVCERPFTQKNNSTINKI